MKLTPTVIAIVLVTIMLPVVALADDGVEFDVSAAPVELTLRDTLILELAVTITGDDSRFDIAEPPAPKIENFELISTGSSSKRIVSLEAPAFKRITRHLFLPLAAGPTIIPALSLDYVEVQTGRVVRLKSSEIRVSVLPDSGGSGRIAGLFLLAAIVLVITITSIYVYKRTQEKRKQVGSNTESREPEAKLSEALDKVGIQLAHGKTADAQRNLIESVEIYLAGRYGLLATGLSGKEAAKELHEAGVPTAVILIWIQLFDWSASLKFSGLSRSESDLAAVVSELRQIVEQSPT